jgi:signal transduction histidine kinase
LARQHGVSLQFETSLDEAYLEGDANGLFRALVNLIRNAVAATGEKPEPVVVMLQRSRDATRLMVRDGGRGIPPGDLDSIFEPGFTTGEHRGGTGMGLTVVKDIAETHFGGRVEVESQVGKGSLFTLILPMPPQRSGEK